jgi:hypothetical protein
MYQALVRLPSSLDTGHGDASPRAHFSWNSVTRFLMRLLARPQTPRR